jgi:hypothetical protein
VTKVTPPSRRADVEIITDPATLESLRSRLSSEQAAEARPIRLPLRNYWSASVIMLPADENLNSNRDIFDDCE